MATDTKTEIPPDVQAKLISSGQLLASLVADPKTRKKTLLLLKEAAPQVSIPELDIAADVEHEVGERTKPLADENKALKERLEKIERTLARKDWRESSGLSEAELVEVEEMPEVKDGKITDGPTAVEVYRMRQQLGTPRGTGVVNALAEDDRKNLLKAVRGGPGALKQHVYKQADRVIREIRGGRGRTV